MVFSLFTRTVLCLYDFWEQWCAQEHNFLSFCTQAKHVISLVHVLKNVPAMVQTDEKWFLSLKEFLVLAEYWHFHYCWFPQHRNYLDAFDRQSSHNGKWAQVQLPLFRIERKVFNSQIAAGFPYKSSQTVQVQCRWFTFIFCAYEVSQMQGQAQFHNLLIIQYLYSLLHHSNFHESVLRYSEISYKCFCIVT